jgi:hypothetical protein
MEVEEHFAFKATCELEDDKKYNVYPTCEGATFRKDKDEDSEYDPDDEMSSTYDSDDDENMTASIVRALLHYIDSRIAMAEPMEAPLFYEDSSELDPTTRTLLNPEAKPTNIDKEDTITQPKIIENPDLAVTFSDEDSRSPTPRLPDEAKTTNIETQQSDEEDDEAGKVPSMQQHDILPNLQYLIYIGHEVNWGGHDYLPLESTVYHIEDVKLSIKGPIHLAAITDHPSYYFLTQVEEELNRLGDEIKSSRYLSQTGKAEINFDISLLGAKIVHYASCYGYSTSPSWTLAKDIPEYTINAMRSVGDSAHLLVHMAQMHIYYQAYIETFWPHLDITTFRTAQFQFMGPDANGRTNIYTGYIETFGDDLMFAHRIDHAAMDNWERVLNAPHDDDGPPCKRRRTGDYEPGDNEPERYSPTSPEYCP